MIKEVRCIVSIIMIAMFAYVGFGCENTNVRKAEAVTTPKITKETKEKPVVTQPVVAQAVQESVVAQPKEEVKKEEVKQETPAPAEHKESHAGCPLKQEEMASHPKDTRTIQEIISQITGEKIGPDDSGDLYHNGLTATYTGPKEVFPGEGKFGKLFSFLPIIRWYDPDHYYTPNMAVSGEFKHEECVMCHTVQTPGIVAQWKKSKHASTEKGVVGCDKCHGNNHQQLYMPSWRHCGECHPEQQSGHRDGKLGSHAYAFHVNVVETPWQIAKPAEEVTACATCHGIAENRCDGCHTRHDFSLAEARKPNNCGICHTGLDHYEYEMYRESYHGMIYESEQHTWDWTKPLKPANYKTPTCAFCHMKDGEHNAQKASTIYSHMGTSLVDRGAPKFKEERQNWINTCKGCHSPRFAADQLNAMDEAVKLSFTKWREAMKVVMDLYNDGMLDPMPNDLAPDYAGHYTFSLLGGEGRMYNVSDIERTSFEMLVYVTNAVYKAMAHGAMYGATYGKGAFLQDRWLVQVKSEASRLRRLRALEDKVGIKHKAYDFWKHGEYTDLLLGWRRKPGDVDKSACKHEGENCLVD
ncbi:MAG: multiheme c-type cytochrome [Candidatus Jettenia sp. CY-1]|nr:hydroxylamine oxidoreductase [Candidatus Jettenia sp.]WKZ19408.1 MAG: multiheme c-type cytochrome [Candidatus Jettenia sp. CY-1]